VRFCLPHLADIVRAEHIGLIFPPVAGPTGGCSNHPAFDAHAELRMPFMRTAARDAVKVLTHHERQSRGARITKRASRKCGVCIGDR
jgi:hypothetical protein